MNADHRGASLATVRRVWAAVTRTPQATIRELADELGLSHGHICDALSVLGYVEHDYGASRARAVIVPLHTSGFRVVARKHS